MFIQAKRALNEHIASLKEAGHPLEDSLLEFLDLNVFSLTADDDKQVAYVL